MVNLRDINRLDLSGLSLIEKKVVVAIAESISFHDSTGLQNFKKIKKSREIKYISVMDGEVNKITYNASDLGLEEIIFKDIETALNGLLDSRIVLKTKSGDSSTRYLLNWKFEKSSSLFEFTVDKEVYQLYNA